MDLFLIQKIWGFFMGGTQLTKLENYPYLIAWNDKNP
jgi:hypothetical protein